MEYPIKKVISSTGKVHLAHVGMWKNGNVDPMCNHMSWRGDYFGQSWKVIEDQNVEVTCRRCIPRPMRNTITVVNLKAASKIIEMAGETSLKAQELWDDAARNCEFCSGDEGNDGLECSHKNGQTFCYSEDCPLLEEK